MITLTIIATLAVLAPLTWLLVETSRRKLLLLAIPALLAAPIGFYAYGTTLLGYAVHDALPEEWTLVHAAVEGDTVYVLLREPGREPRLHVIHGATQEQRKAAGQAQAAAGKGVPVRGRRGSSENEGDFVFYVLPPSGGAKEG